MTRNQSYEEQNCQEQRWGAETDPVHLAHYGVPPELLFAEDESASEPVSRSLLLTAAEVEVMLCFTLTSPLHYGSVEDSLCDKLSRYLRGLYRFQGASALET